MRFPCLALLVLPASLGCGGDSEPGDDAGSDGDADADSDSDADGDVDVDADSDVDGDGDTDADSDTDADADGDGVPEGCEAQADAPGDYWCTLAHDGLEREYWLHVPAQRPDAGAPLLFNFHGYTSNARQQAGYSEMIEKSDAEGFLAVHAEGTGNLQSWNAGDCCGKGASGGVDDVGFALAMIERVSSALDVDASRIFTTGLSNGGFLSHRLGCEQAGVFAAAGPVAGLVGIDGCAPARPFPVIQFHGTEDQLVPYDGGGFSGYDSVAETLEGWASRNGCESTRTVTYQNGNVTCERWEGCPDGGDVELCTVDGGGHNWPGGEPIPLMGEMTEDISATDAMWTFFQAHPLP